MINLRNSLWIKLMDFKKLSFYRKIDFLGAKSFGLGENKDKACGKTRFFAVAFVYK